jgi:hypothetical protein
MFVPSGNQCRKIVVAGARGAYVDGSEVKQPRLKCVVHILMELALTVILAGMVNWRIVILTDSKIEMAHLCYVSDVGHLRFPQNLQPQRHLTGLLEGHHPPNSQCKKRGKALYPAIIVRFSGTLIVSIPLSLICHPSARSGCVQTMQINFLYVVFQSLIQSLSFINSIRNGGYLSKTYLQS